MTSRPAGEIGWPGFTVERSRTQRWRRPTSGRGWEPAPDHGSLERAAGAEQEECGQL